MKTSSKEGIEDYFNITNKQKMLCSVSFIHTYHSLPETLMRCLMMVITKIPINMMDLSNWKYNYFELVGVFTMVHDCGVSQFPQLYDKSIKIKNVTSSICVKL